MGIYFITYSKYYKDDILIYSNILAPILNKNNIEYNVVQNHKKHIISDEYLYIGHFNIKCMKFPKYYIQISGDSIAEKTFYNCNRDIFQNTQLILDYSKHNIWELEHDIDIVNKTKYVPFGYHNIFDINKKYDKKHNKKYDVIFYGGYCEYRKTLINKLNKNGINTVWINNNGKTYLNLNELKDHITDSTIVLSLLKRKKDCNDLHRLRTSICCKVLILAEETIDIDFNKFLQKFDLIVDSTNIVDKCKKYLDMYNNNNDEYINKVNLIYDDFLKYYTISDHLLSNHITNIIINLIK